MKGTNGYISERVDKSSTIYDAKQKDWYSVGISLLNMALPQINRTDRKRKLNRHRTERQQNEQSSHSSLPYATVTNEVGNSGGNVSSGALGEYSWDNSESHSDGHYGGEIPDRFD